MTDMGPCRYYLGMTVTRDRVHRILRLGHAAHVEKILRDNGMWDSNSNTVPMIPTARPVPAPPGYTAEEQFRTKYQIGTGSLMYAMLGTRPDIAFAVSVISRYASNPTVAHSGMLKQILRYLKGTIHLQLTFRGALKPLAGYTDSDFAGDHDTRRSTSGYVFNIGSGTIS